MNNRNRPLRTRQYNDGYCAICEEYGQLTDDHIFLKATGSAKPRELRTLAHQTDPTLKPLIAQDGLKFRTICQDCNSGVLGSQYDPELVNLCRQVTSYVEAASRSGLVVPDGVPVRYKPLRVARALIGHSLAAHIHRDVNVRPLQAPVQKSYRSFVLNEHLPMPPAEIYWRFYDASREVAIDFCAYMWLNGAKVYGSFLKFRPFAFWIVYKPLANNTLPLQTLVPSSSLSLDSEIETRFSFRSPLPPTWPERPHDNGMICLVDTSFVIATPLKRSATTKATLLRSNHESQVFSARDAQF